MSGTTEAPAGPPPDPDLSRRRALVVLPGVALLVGLLVTFVLRLVSGNLASDSVRERFEDRAEAAMDAAEVDISFYLDEIRDIANFTAVDELPEASRFRTFVVLSGVLDQAAGEQAVAYLETDPLQPSALRLLSLVGEGDEIDPGVLDLSGLDALAGLVATSVGDDPVLAASPAAHILDLEALLAGLDERAAAAAAGEPGATDPFAGSGWTRADLLAALQAAFGAPEGAAGAFVPAIAVPVIPAFSPEPVGWIVAELLPQELLAASEGSVDGDVTVAVSLLGGSSSIELQRPPADEGRAAARAFRAEGFEWSLRASAPSGFGGGTVGSAQQMATVAGLVLTLVAVGLVFVRGRTSISTQEIREELGATQVVARRDVLTGLVNRAGFMESLERAIGELDQAHRYVAVLFVDVDRLKVINDSLGHSTGDLALVEIGRRFGAIGRWTDTVARFGGDEFVLLCSGLQTPEDSVRVAEQVLLSLAQPIKVDEMELVMTASIGVAVASRASNPDAESLVRDADTAMYEAKAAGGNRIMLFDDGLRVKVTGRLQVERTLRTAVENGELDVHFQPIVDAATGRIVSAEALVRWFPREGGSISPGVFMPVAAETGMVVQIGDFVLQRACLLASELERMYPGMPPISIAVNVAERQLLDPGFVSRVRQFTQAARIWPRQITLEITEDVMIDRLGRSLEVLRKLADIGFGLAIDDFGTGMSSLSYVKRLDMVRVLKIDRSFVIDVARDPADRAIVSSVVAMARSLGVTVVAEGVEEPEQADVLSRLGVDRMQGFLWSKAVPAHEFRDIVRRVMGPAPVAPAAPVGQPALVPPARR